jgi:pimeloyl-ACP methyl ester carboxylesterase
MTISDLNLTVQGLHIRCLTAGSGGSPIVLLHGGGADSATLSWSLTIEVLAQQHRVYAPDLPGYGDSDRPDLAYTTDYYLKFVRDLLDALGLARTNIAGLSMGGGLALALALNYPDRVDRLIPVDSYGLQDHVVMHKLSYLVVWTPGLNEITWSLMRHSDWMLRYSLRSILRNPAAITAELIAELKREARRPHAGRAFHSYQKQEVLWNGLRTCFMSRLKEITAPTLIIHGAQDSLVPLALAQQAQQIMPNCRLHVIDQCGHWPQRDTPAEFNRVITEFLKDD